MMTVTSASTLSSATTASALTSKAQNATGCRKEADMSKQKLHFLYARLSKDDGEDSTSLSIKNQRQLLTDCAEKNGLTSYRFVDDDGFSGARWNRPGWMEIMEEFEKYLITIAFYNAYQPYYKNHDAYSYNNPCHNNSLLPLIPYFAILFDTYYCFAIEFHIYINNFESNKPSLSIKSREIACC